MFVEAGSTDLIDDVATDGSYSVPTSGWESLESAIAIVALTDEWLRQSWM